ncbi:hypothetical protein [Streptomyces sp. NPDC056242]|uniref:hypothetical protein n=1 Tax=Streptomyces sp. NPDC056242 TaxID=3345760 RepID=UPI0035DA9FC4
MTSTTGEAVVVVSGHINAPAQDIFRILADPGLHPDLDGCGILRGGIFDFVVSDVADVLVMRMYYETFGSYEMNNHVVAYEPVRPIGWEPRPGRGHPDATGPRAAWGNRWVFNLLPDGPTGSMATEIVDGSPMPVDKRAAVDSGRVWWQTRMASALECLAEWSVVR